VLKLGKWAEFAQQIVDQLSSKADKRLMEEVDSILLMFKARLLRFVDQCESPIEKLLAIHLAQFEDIEIHEFLEYDKDARIKVETQKEIKCLKNMYRVDILITVRFQGKYHLFAIECDGHDFHEKTKEQARNDRKRERDLMVEGIHVIRFTGSEIYEDPLRCANDVRKIIHKLTGLDDVIFELIRAEESDS
jgi:very-short-patch-repair endonuclease